MSGINITPSILRPNIVNWKSIPVPTPVIKKEKTEELKQYSEGEKLQNQKETLERKDRILSWSNNRKYNYFSLYFGMVWYVWVCNITKISHTTEKSMSAGIGLLSWNEASDKNKNHRHKEQCPIWEHGVIQQ